MVVCDRCMGKDAHEIAVPVRKFDGKNRLGRELIRVRMTLCEQCISDWLKLLGRTKISFMKEPDDPE